MAAIKMSEKEFKNMAGATEAPAPKKIKIAGNAIVLTSTLKFETIQKMEKLDKNSLCLVEVKNDEENEVFRIATGKQGSISKYGIVFSEANKNGYATATVLLPENVTDKKGYIKENFMTTLIMLNQLEEVVATHCAELETMYENLENEIEEI